MTDINQFYLGSPNTPGPPRPRTWQSRSGFGGSSSQQRAAVCQLGVKVIGGEELASAPGAWNSTWCGLQPCPPGSQDVAKAARPKQLRWAYSPLPVAQGSGKEISFRASFAGGIKYRTGRHSCQAEAGGAVNRTMLFVVRELQESLLCMCQGLLGRLFDPHGDLRVARLCRFTCEESEV